MKTLFLILSLICTTFSSAQDNNGTSYSFVSGYIGTAIPIGSLSENGFSDNFNSATSLVFPVGFNLNMSEKFSYSIELDPVITFTGDSSSISNLALLPGVLLHQPKVSYGIRVAFETGGRYGMSFSVLKNILKREKMSLVVGLPLDIRTGNKSPISVGTGLILVAVI